MTVKSLDERVALCIGDIMLRNLQQQFQLDTLRGKLENERAAKKEREEIPDSGEEAPA